MVWLLDGLVVDGPTIQPSLPARQARRQATWPLRAHAGRQPSNNPPIHPTIQPSNHPTIQPSNHPTIQPSSHPTIQQYNHPTIITFGSPRSVEYICF
ncbi:MAG: PT domain-containing protein [Lewinellaceae bacterium]|nr:PT domain-containing protein [Phaeodactylibacter sp.]MCB9039849.1 PT domain-containing protein [Lewinellaceae bacterium]